MQKLRTPAGDRDRFILAGCNILLHLQTLREYCRSGNDDAESERTVES